MANIVQSAISSIRRKADEILNDNQGWFRGGKFTPAQQVQRIGSDVGYQVRDFANQTAQKAWSPTGVLGGSVNAIQSGINTVSNLPRIELFKQQREQIQNPILRTGTNLAAGIPESLVNIPRNYVVGISRTGQELGTAIKEGRPLNLQNLAGGVAPLTESLVDVGTFGFGKPVVSAFKEGAKLGVKQAIKKEALKGAGLGALGGLTYGVDTQYGKDFNVGEVAQNVAGGALLGSVVGGATGGAGAIKSKLFGGYKKLGLPDNVADDLANKHFIRSENRPVVIRQPKAQKEFNAKINTVLKRPLNTPVFTDDLKKYTNIVEGLPDTELGIGMTIKSRSKNPLEISTKGVEAIQQKGIAPQMEPTQIKQPQTKVNTLAKLEQQGYPQEAKVTKEIAKVVEGKPSVVSISPKGRLNTKNLNLTDEAKAQIDELQNNIPVTVISNKDVVAKSRLTAGRKTAMTDDQMKDILAKQLNSRQEVVSLQREFDKLKANGASLDELASMKGRIAEQSRIAQQQGTFAGRLLQSQNILANEYATPEQKIYALLDNAGIDQSKYIKDAVNVDFNDPKQVVEFYRKHVPANFGDILTEIRYTNMLSSPLTQIVNTFSNVLQSGIVKPIEKTITGGLDAISSKLTGKERQYFASQGIDYAKGYYSALPEAFTKFKNIVSGKEMNISPDFEHIPTATKGALKWYTTPLRTLEASDQFFRTLVIAGEKKSLGKLNLSESELLKRASESADYSLFRQKFDPDGKLGQGIVLRTWDKWNTGIQMLRRMPGGNWILPFLQTPTNILKQGMEYSPLGLTTMIGAKHPLEQLSKAMIGSAAFMGLYGLADKGATTWDTPTNPSEKELFYAAGLQPYSIKVGDKWVSYSKLGPLAYPLAMASALKWVEKNNPDQNVAENLRDALGQMVGFFGDQSYVKSIGDVIEAIKGGSSNKLASAVSGEINNLSGQLVPYRSFLGWITRMIDPVYRKPEGLGQNLAAQIPGLSESVPAYTDLQGQPSQRDLPILNSFSPLKVSVEKPGIKPLLETKESARIARAVDKKQFEKGGNEAVQSGNIIFYTNENGNRSELDLTKYDKVAQLPSANKYQQAIKESKQYSEAAKIMDNTALTQEQQQQALQRLGIDSDKASYYQVANDNDNLKTMFVLDAVNRVKTQGGGLSDVLNLIANQRTEVNGKMIASNGVLDNLVDEGVLTKSQATELKKYKMEDGKLTAKKLSVKKPKKITAKKVSVAKLPTLKSYKFKKIKSYSKLKVKRLKVAKRLKLNTK